MMINHKPAGRILIAEDEPDLRNLLTINLEQAGYQILPAADGLTALELFRKETVDLAIFDIMMPHLDGLSLLRKIRETSLLPIILLTARGEDYDKVLGLDLGADDYLAKPFSLTELVARVGALLRRSRQTVNPERAPTVLMAGDLLLDTEAATVCISGHPVLLNAKEFKLLYFFLSNPGRVFTRQQIYQAVWTGDPFAEDNTVMVHISNLRGKIESDPKNPTRLITIRGVGYKFIGSSGQSGPSVLDPLTR